jgi:hypothetical protein
MNNLERASNPHLQPLEFKELLGLEDVEIYEALDLNETASERYMAFLETQPQVNYFPSEDDFDSQTIVKANQGDHIAQFLMAIVSKNNGDEEEAVDWV